MPKPTPKDWEGAKKDAGEFGPLIEKLKEALARGTTPAERKANLWQQLMENGNTMLAEGKDIEDLLRGAKYMVKWYDHYTNAIHFGV